MKTTDVQKVISAMMSAASKARSPESRKKAGAKAWQTRLKNLSEKPISPGTTSGE